MQEPLFDALEGLSTAIMVFDRFASLIWSNSSGLDLLQTPLESIRGSDASRLLSERLGLPSFSLDEPRDEGIVEATLVSGARAELRIHTRHLSQGGYRLLYLESVDGAPETRSAEPVPSELSDFHQEVFRALLESSLDLILVLDRQGVIKLIAPSAAKLLGVGTSQLLERRLIDNIASEDRRAFEQLLSPGPGRQTQELDIRMRRSDGELRVFETRLVDLRHYPRIDGFLILARDISQRRRAEEAVRESQLRYRRLFDQSRDIVSISDREGGLIDVNRAGLELLGYETKEQILSLDIGRGIWGNPEARREVFRQAKARGYAEFETLFTTVDKGERLVSGTMVEMRDDQGHPEGYLTIVRDVTDQRQVEDQLRQSQKMEAIGRLAGGIAHDFNNLLTAIAGYCDLLLDEAPNEEMRSYVREIEAAGTRASDLTAKLLTLSRRERVIPKVIDLNMSVRELQGLLRRLIGEDIKLEFELATEPGYVRVDAGQLDQTILNLAANARDAMPQGGSLTLRTETRRVTPDEQEGAPHPSTAPLEPGQYVCLTVADTGVGMDARTLQHIYEPFFTTKEAGKGTGLGLATAYATIHRFGGSIEVSSLPGQGSTFSVFLPRVEPDVADEPSSVSPQPPDAAKGNETILLVEDDDTVRHLVTTQLKRQGYRVLTAGDGESALTRLTDLGEGNNLDLLVSDVVMPGMSGPELAIELRRTRPQLPILFISGYTGSFMIQHGFCEGIDEILQKPFTAKMLAVKVRSLLDRAPQ